jgi:exodeoxyribonuclease VII large subunit
MAVRWLFSDDDEEKSVEAVPPARPVTKAPSVSIVPVAPVVSPPKAKPAPPATTASAALPQPVVLSVTQLTAAIKGTLQTSFSSIRVRGEVTGAKLHSSGHLYFTLKDEGSQIPAVMFRSAVQRLKFKVEAGQFVCEGDLDVHLPHGKYQLIVQRIEPDGLGAQELALRQLKARLEAEGLFRTDRKRKLPTSPRRIGFVTSPSGAVIHDFAKVIRRRFRGVHLLVIPAKVQGPGAAAEIARGIELANRLQPALDVLIVGRGGGSAEDLSAFNEEAVVRAIHASRVPVVSAVGHETDTTLADYVADVRAATPTEAAEKVVPSAADLREQLAACSRRMKSSLVAQLTSARRHLELLAHRRVLTHPLDRLHDRARTLDDLSNRIEQAIRRQARRSRETLIASAARLESLSPLRVLSRGYSVTQRLDGRVIRDASELTTGEQISTRLAQGEVISRVETIKPETKE